MHIQKPSIYIRPKCLCNFVMTERTSLNLRVFDSVCGYMGAEHSPTSMTCNMHILMMFHQKAKKAIQSFHNGMGHAKTKNWFLVNIVFKSVFTKKSFFYEVRLAKRAFYH